MTAISASLSGPMVLRAVNQAEAATRRITKEVSATVLAPTFWRKPVDDLSAARKLATPDRWVMSIGSLTLGMRTPCRRGRILRPDRLHKVNFCYKSLVGSPLGMIES